MIYLLGTTVGIFSASIMPLFIPPELLLLPIFVLIVLFFWLRNSWFFLLSVLIGLAWGFNYGYKQLSVQLLDRFDRQEFIVRGSIIGLVQTEDQRTRFKFLIESAQLKDKKGNLSNHNGLELSNVLLSWYNNRAQKKDLKTGEDWQFVVRLKKPRGMVNQSAFDYQAWLFEHSISATGYVVESQLNQLIGPLSCSFFCRFHKEVNRLRESIKRAINYSNLTSRDKAIIRALTIGDKHGLSPWWNDLARFGIVHLMVISGLHIGLIAGFGYWIGSIMGRIVGVFLLLTNTRFKHTKLLLLAPLMSLMVAIFYSFLAGFTLPTQRALIVVVLVMLPRVFYFPLRVDSLFIGSLFLIALFQPLAVLGASFWLSFGAVLVLLLYFSPRIFMGPKIQQIVTSQMILFVGMSAPLIIFIGQVSWLSIWVNLFAVPTVSMVTVPLCLVASAVYFFMPHGAEIIWQWAGISIDTLWYLFELVPQDWGLFSLSIPNSKILFGALILASCCFMIPKGLISRWLLILPLALLLVTYKPRAPLRLTVLDVGQGLAVVAEAGDNILVYDSGPLFSPQFNAGSAVIAPYIKRRGFRSIDKLIISHGDMDHSGGFLGLNASMKVEQNLLAPGYYNKVKNKTSTPTNIWQCDSSIHWAWPYKPSSWATTQWILFDVLLPLKKTSNQVIPDDNNFSCVLLIRWGHNSILLTGDIERSAEVKLLKYYNLPSASVLVAPHHGSKTSSSQLFVDRLKPLHVVFSAGYRHHFGHPHRDVLSRYKKSGAKLWNTALDGGITFEWNANGDLVIETARESGAKYWWR